MQCIATLGWRHIGSEPLRLVESVGTVESGIAGDTVAGGACMTPAVLAWWQSAPAVVETGRQACRLVRQKVQSIPTRKGAATGGHR